MVSASLASSLVLVAVGCKDPTKDAAKATAEAPVAAPTPAPKASEIVPFDSKTSKVTFVGSKVTGSHSGSFGTFDGRIELADGKPEASLVKVDIDMKSVDTDTPKLTGHLKSGDFFDIEKYPKASFVSTKIVAGGEKGATHTITGNLELRGVTKSVSFPATITVTAEGVKATAEFSIDRTQWGITYEGMADNLIRKDVLLKLDLSAPRKKA
ncbi:MAG: YceI family protein [Deltaproteobacteria bacterium]|nr:YceI family protein [Deltaproteobacteria bacterium]